jgi:hypothetical protein
LLRTAKKAASRGKQRADRQQGVLAMDSRITQFDELAGADGRTRAPYRKLSQWLAETPPELLASRRESRCELLFVASASPSRSMARRRPPSAHPSISCRALARRNRPRSKKGLISALPRSTFLPTSMARRDPGAESFLPISVYRTLPIARYGGPPRALRYFRAYRHRRHRAHRRSGLLVLEDNAGRSGVSICAENRE